MAEHSHILLLLMLTGTCGVGIVISLSQMENLKLREVKLLNPSCTACLE